MSDLISREVAIKVVENLCVDGKMWGNEGLTLIDAYEAITELSDLPTAYDVDKVVEQIEENILSTETIRRYDAGRRDAYYDAIELVKAGGKE
jgi:hypothetical protein